MNYLPIAINIGSQQILVVGGGKVAFQKIGGLLRYTRNIKVVAPLVRDEIKAIAGLEIIQKHYDKSDLGTHWVVYAATDSRAINEQIWADGQANHCLVNVVDNPALSNFSSPAIFKNDEVSIAVSTNGSNVKNAIHIRNIIKKIAENGGLEEK